jgi:chromosome segregation ATPase
LVELAKAATDARQALDHKLTADPGVTAARKAIADASTAVKQALDAAYAASPEAQTLTTEAAKLNAAADDYDFDQRINRYLLGEYSAKLFKDDAELKDLRAKLDQASKTLRGLKKGDDKLAAAKADYDTADKAYNQGLSARQAANPTTAEFVKKIDAAAKGAQDVRTQLEENHKKAAKLRTDLSTTNPQVQAARAAVQTANDKVHQAITVATSDQDKAAIDNAQKAYDTQQDKLVAADPRIIALRDALEDVKGEIEEVDLQISAQHRQDKHAGQ